jgi:hypothetical protein
MQTIVKKIDDRWEDWLGNFEKAKNDLSKNVYCQGNSH